MSPSADAGSARELAGRAVASALAALGTLPFWLGPAAESLSARHPGIIDVLVALSPVTHLAVASGNDLLHNPWLYEHSNLAVLPVSYPGLGTLAMGYASACAVLAIAVLASQRRPPDRPPSDRSHPGADAMIKRRHVLALPALRHVRRSHSAGRQRHGSGAAAPDAPGDRHGPPLPARPAGAGRLDAQLRGHHGACAACLPRESGEVQRERWRVRHTPGRLHREQGPARRIDQLDVAGDGLQHRRRLERTGSDRRIRSTPR